MTLTRVSASLTYPAHIMLVAAMNPCPCGFLGDRTRECLCTPYQIRRYRGRLSGPLMDRLDIHLDIPAVPVGELTQGAPSESSDLIRKRVTLARQRQSQRYQRERLFSNAQLKPRHLKKYCQIDAEGTKPGRTCCFTTRLVGAGLRPDSSCVANDCGFSRL